MTDIFSSFINVKKYAIGNGIVDDSSALIAANAEASTSTSGNKTIFLPTGTYRISNNVTISSNVKLLFDSGASVSVDSGKIFIINGIIDANLYQSLFSGAGTISIGRNVVSISVVWFGADPTGNIDSLPAFNTAINALITPATTSSGPHWTTSAVGPTFPNPYGSGNQWGSKVVIPPGTYWQNGTLYAPKISLTIEGGGPGNGDSANTVIVTPPGIGAFIQPKSSGGLVLKNIIFSHNGANVNGNHQGVSDLLAVVGPYFAKWTSGFTYNTGDIVSPNYHNRFGYAMQCVTGGTSAGPTTPNYAGFTFTVLTATDGYVINFNVMGSDNISHAVSYTVGISDTTTTVAAAIVTILQAITNLTNLGATGVSSSGPIITVKRTDGMFTVVGGWNTSYLSYSLAPANNWRSFEPNLNGLINTYGVNYFLPAGAQIRNWMPNAYYAINDVIITVPGDGYFYQATSVTTGQTATIPPSFPMTIGGTVVDNGVTWTCLASSILTDGYATWQPIIAHGIDLMSGLANIENVFIYGYPGNAFNINSSFEYLGGFGNRISDCGHYNCGGSGIFATGGNTGENTFINVAGWYSKGWHIFDDCGSQNTYITCVMEDCEAGFAYALSGCIINGYKEETDSGMVAAPGSIFIGDIAGGIANPIGSSQNQNIGFSGNYAPTWTANATVAAGSRIVPITQPDPNEGFIYYTPLGGTTGASEPTWNPGYGNGSTPDSSYTVDGSVLWKTDNYTKKSAGTTVGQRPDSATTHTNTFGSHGVNVGLATDEISPSGNGDLAALSVSTNDSNDTTPIGFYYDSFYKRFLWQHGSSGTQGLGLLLNNNPFSYTSSSVASSGTIACFPDAGFFMGIPATNGFIQIFSASNPGYDYLGQGFSTGAFAITNGYTGNPGGAAIIRNVKAGLAYLIWKPNFNYTLNQEVLSNTSNGHLYKCTTAGLSGNIPVTWNTSGGTCSDGYIIWTDQGTITNSQFFPMAPIISEDIYYLDLTSKFSPYTLSAYECAHRVIRVFNASGPFTIIVKTSDVLENSASTAILLASINTWSKVFDNVSGQTITVAATISDTGVAITNGNNSFLWNDGVNVKKPS